VFDIIYQIENQRPRKKFFLETKLAAETVLWNCFGSRTKQNVLQMAA
jgi:hypothetical protein